MGGGGGGGRGEPLTSDGCFKSGTKSILRHPLNRRSIHYDFCNGTKDIWYQFVNNIHFSTGNTSLFL